MTDQTITKIGVIAGGGRLPFALVEACQKANVEVFVVGFEGHTDDALFDMCNHKKSKLGKIGKIIKYFKAAGVSDLVMIGSIKRPSFSELVPDLKATKFLSSVGLKALGDSDLLSALRVFLEDEGFNVRGVQEFVPDILMPDGVITDAKPSKEDWIDIRRGLDVLGGLSQLDIGQAVVVQEGLVLGVEAIEGTAALIQRCGELKRNGREGVLVKLCKEQQDTSLDLPTIGMESIRLVKEAGFGGIAVHAQKSLVIDREELVSYANTHNLYVVGIDPDNLSCDM